jgi:3-hydroxybutyryl-CoA dehydratase
MMLHSVTRAPNMRAGVVALARRRTRPQRGAAGSACAAAAAQTRRRMLFTAELRNGFSVGMPQVGEVASCTHAFAQGDVDLFAGLCGDKNPLHTDPAFAATTMFRGPIVHGIFVSSLFSTIFGSTVPGSVYVSQDLKFRAPVHVGAPVTATVTIVGAGDGPRRKTMKMLTCKTQAVLGDGTIAVDGIARVLVPIHPPRAAD